MAAPRLARASSSASAKLGSSFTLTARFWGGPATGRPFSFGAGPVCTAVCEYGDFALRKNDTAVTAAKIYLAQAIEKFIKSAYKSSRSYLLVVLWFTDMKHMAIKLMKFSTYQLLWVTKTSRKRHFGNIY